MVTLNGIVASAAATEVLQLVTGFAGDRAQNCGWIYDGLTGATEPTRKAQPELRSMPLRAWPR